jgi:PIN domain nuclease of toxin-antitoxin system
VTVAVLLDTDIVLWLDSGNARLRPSARVLIDGHWHNGGTVFLSAVTAWEIALLVDTGRIEPDSTVEAWIERFLGRPPGSRLCRWAFAPPAEATGCTTCRVVIPRTGC